MYTDELCRLIMCDDLTPDLRQCYKYIGMDNVLLLMEHHGGKKLYIPKLDVILLKPISRLIKEKYKDGITLQALASEYGISIKTASKYLHN